MIRQAPLLFHLFRPSHLGLSKPGKIVSADSFSTRQPLSHRCNVASSSLLLFWWQMFRWALHSFVPPVLTITSQTHHVTSSDLNQPIFFHMQWTLYIIPYIMNSVAVSMAHVQMSASFIHSTFSDHHISDTPCYFLRVESTSFLPYIMRNFHSMFLSRTASFAEQTPT